jgi:hypothetical protein
MHVPKPGPGIHRKVANQLEDGQRHEGNLIGQVFGKGVTGKTRFAIDHHGTCPADAGAAAKIELKRRILLLPKLSQGDKKSHALSLFQSKSVRMRDRMRILRIVAEYVESQLS